MAVTSVAQYRRRVAASLERVWENVLDWEHLPWLHSSTFTAVSLQEWRADGFRARLSMHRGEPFVFDVTVDYDARCYHNRTVSGPGAGSDIVTQLTPAGPRATDVAVEFLLTDVPPEHADRVGAYYVRLYTRLWDEDEAMMVRRQAVLDAAQATPVTQTIDLGPRAALLARLPLAVDTAAGPVRVVARGDTIVAHANVCPHLGGPLDAAAPDADGCVTCPWHGYRFDPATGASCDGRRFTLRPHATVDTAPDGRASLRVR